MNQKTAPHEELRLFISKEHPCGYFPERTARSLVPDPDALDVDVYSSLANLGFRRNGNLVYRPHCQGCKSCIAMRISAEHFKPNRSQKRVSKANAGLAVEETHARYNEEHFKLFKRYISNRHPKGGMDDNDEERYEEFIASDWCDTRLIEFRDGDSLVAVAVTDHLNDGLSALYTFFEPDLAPRSLGTAAILWQVEEAGRLGLPWVYLGYWIEDCQKMAYKQQFGPSQILQNGRWRWMGDLGGD